MDNLRKLRLERGYTQIEMADIFHMATNTYRNYERHVRQPNAEALIMFAEYFHVSVDYLLGHTTNRFPVDEAALEESEYTFMKYYRGLTEEAQKIVYNLTLDLTHMLNLDINEPSIENDSE